MMCAYHHKRRDVALKDTPGFHIIRSELAAGMELTKCQQCGCMQETLDALASCLATEHTDEAQTLAGNVIRWRAQMQPIRYTCLGCAYCYPAVAQNAFPAAFLSLNHLPAMECNFDVRPAEWPPVVGEYEVLDQTAAVAVSTLASVALVKEVVVRQPRGLALIGKTETENIGVDKVVKNIITNPTLRSLILAGKEATGHRSGSTLLALAAHGIDHTGRVIHSPGKRPILRNVSASEVAAFRAQVQVIDMMGCESPEELCGAIEAFAQQEAESCSCHGEAAPSTPQELPSVPRIRASEPSHTVKLDKAGYFVIVALPAKGSITVEHYAYDNTLLRMIEGTTARAICATLLAHGWVTELSHAAYLGRELAKAELSLSSGFTYVQDGA
jgi:tetrahydromethanopterin S-methyltransferase subunit A